jgi:hypothetical protein
MSAMCASVAFRTSFLKKKKKNYPISIGKNWKRIQQKMMENSFIIYHVDDDKACVRDPSKTCF